MAFRVGLLVLRLLGLLGFGLLGFGLRGLGLRGRGLLWRGRVGPRGHGRRHWGGGSAMPSMR